MIEASREGFSDPLFGAGEGMQERIASRHRKGGGPKERPLRVPPVRPPPLGTSPIRPLPSGRSVWRGFSAAAKKARGSFFLEIPRKPRLHGSPSRRSVTKRRTEWGKGGFLGTTANAPGCVIRRYTRPGFYARVILKKKRRKLGAGKWTTGISLATSDDRGRSV